MNRFEIPGTIFAFLIVVGLIAVIGKGFWMASSWVIGG